MKMLPFIDFTTYSSPQADADTKVFLKFVNLTQSSIALFWHNFTGDITKYSTILAGHSINMHTFIGHIWSFVDEATGDHLIDDQNNYYVTIQGNSTATSQNTQVIKIKTPLLTLKGLCYKFIRNELVSNNNMVLYEQMDCLPVIIREELRYILIKGMTYKHTPHIAQETDE